VCILISALTFLSMDGGSEYQEDLDEFDDAGNLISIGERKTDTPRSSAAAPGPVQRRRTPPGAQLAAAVNAAGQQQHHQHHQQQGGRHHQGGPPHDKQGGHAGRFASDTGTFGAARQVSGSHDHFFGAAGAGAAGGRAQSSTGREARVPDSPVSHPTSVDYLPRTASGQIINVIPETSQPESSGVTGTQVRKRGAVGKQPRGPQDRYIKRDSTLLTAVTEGAWMNSRATHTSCVTSGYVPAVHLP
jgi:hypothetical protein